MVGFKPAVSEHHSAHQCSISTCCVHVQTALSSLALCLQDFDPQEETRLDVPPTTSAALLSPATADTVTQGSSMTMSGSDMVPDLSISQQVIFVNTFCI